jgi:isoleucyl-tRNA synthetase
MFEEPIKKTFAEREHDIIEFWNQEKIFERSIQERQDNPSFIFNDGPPFATGLPHYGHLLASTIKDAVCRYMTMKGFHVPRRFGWDCHGLPIESLVEKKQGLSGGASIRDFGIARFNETCRENVLTFTEQWKSTIERMGRWVDMDSSYKTMDPTFMESLWWIFKQLHGKDLVYKGYKVMPFSWKLGTPLSNFEAGENYRMVDDQSLVVSFQDKEQEDLYYLAWTTTPWTLVSNMALVIGPNIEYAEVLYENKRYIVATERLQDIFKNKNFTYSKSWQAKELEARRYQPLFEYYSTKADEGAFRLIVGDFVTTQDGTGIVHAAPAFGEDDFEVCKRHQIPLVCPINENGLFDETVGEFSGALWKDCQKEIIKKLKAQALLFSQDNIHHRYPFCYRTDTPLIYRVTDTWFIAVEKLKSRLIAHNQTINWIPDHIKQGRFGKWLEGVKDWAISRNRFWGTPIPIWQSEDGEVMVIGSRLELAELSRRSIDDIHRHFIDDIVLEHNGKKFYRIDGVFDCWFESGAMPYAQNHYPFENVALTESSMTADFIAEGLDQTRGWFYTLHVLACALFDKPAFKNVIVNGIILAEDGNKMSKRLQNYPDPSAVLEKYGADALRLYLLKSPVVRAEDLAFNEAGVESVLKLIFLPWWNAYLFFITYAKLYDWKAQPEDKLNDQPLKEMDHWILSRLQTLIEQVTQAMSRYRLWEAIAPIVAFIEDLTNWYIRRCRRRFWSEDRREDRDVAMHTLYHSLSTLCRVTAPFAPFISESMWQGLREKTDSVSVHLGLFPSVDENRQNTQLEQVMYAIQKLASMGHALRKEYRLKVRQPLRKAWIVDTTGLGNETILKYSHILKEELNVRSIGIKSHASEILKIILKPNFKHLGPRAGKLMKPISAWIEQMSFDTYQQLKSAPQAIEIQNQVFLLQADDVTMAYELLPGQIAAYNEGLAIALETELDDDLILEGLAREIINKVNSKRKEQELKITDRIHLQLLYQKGSSLQPRIEAMLEAHRNYISEETLSLSIKLQEILDLQQTDSIFEFEESLIGFRLQQV